MRGNRSYELPTGGYALDVSLPDTIGVDTGQMSCRLLFASGRRQDDVGDVTEVGGIILERHKLNPVVLLDHGKQATFPIALAETRSTKEYTVEVDLNAQELWATVYFYQGEDSEHARLSAQVFDLVAKRLIRAGSFGYKVVHATPLPGDWAEGIPPGNHLLRTLLLELSIVVMPASRDTVVKMLEPSFRCDGSPLCDVLVKSLERFRQPEPPPLRKSGLVHYDPPDDEGWQIDHEEIKSLRLHYRHKSIQRPVDEVDQYVRESINRMRLVEQMLEIEEGDGKYSEAFRRHWKRGSR